MNIKEIKEILQLMKEHDLSELEMENDGLRLKLKKSSSGGITIENGDELKTIIPAQAPQVQAVNIGTKAEPKDDPNVYIVKSPMVGTFYAAPAPDQPSYVNIGQSIKNGDVLCIVEAMKLMNEIKSEAGGSVTEILVKNGQPVEFDQPLFKIKKA